MTGTLDLEEAKLGTSQKSVFAATASSEESPEAVFQAWKDAQSKAKSSENDSGEAALDPAETQRGPA